MLWNGQPVTCGACFGTFAESLAKHRREGTMPMMFFGHQAHELPIGDWMEMSEDGKGLLAKGALDLEDPVSLRVHRALKRKRVRGLSIGYRVPPGGEEPDEKRPGVTILKKIDLVEVSVVNMPANRRSLISSVKSDAYFALRDKLLAGDRPSIRELEKGMRDAFDLSNSEAERAVRLVFKDDAPGEPGKPAG